MTQVTSAAAGVLEESHTVTVVERPTVAAVAARLTVRRGEAVTLACRATGVPRPVVHWHKWDILYQPITC